MFIQTEVMPDPTRMKFYPGETVLPSGVAEFPDEEAAERSPLASRLFEIDGVDAVTLYDSFITVTREDGFDWQILKPMILGAIMDHYTSGAPVLHDGSAPVAAATSSEDMEFPFEDDAKDAGTIEQVHEVLESRIRPAAQQMGGAAGELDGQRPGQASHQQRQAISDLQGLMEGLKQAASPKRAERGNREGGRGARKDKVVIPGAEDHEAPAEFRKDLLEAMKDKAPETYEQQVKRYYESLVE